MATEKQLMMRIVATKNISKITKSMKMVSASKLRGDQQRLVIGKPFSVFTERLSEPPVPAEEFDVSKLPQKNLFVPMTTDRGLCGGVNSFITRSMKRILQNLDGAGKSGEIVVVGEKGRAQMRRAFPARIQAVASDITPPVNFAVAGAVAQVVLRNQFDAVHLVYNRFKSAIAFIPTVKTLKPILDVNAEILKPYEVEPDRDADTLQNLFEFTLSAQIYYAMLEGATSEQSSRMNAMENASKNAGEMIERLTLKYNRARQARITTELIEIISGASALKG
jgi:F-type H+-transporting ATPase subunit gamma